LEPPYGGFFLAASWHSTRASADAIRSHLARIHSNTALLTEMRDLALIVCAARRRALMRSRPEQRLPALNLHRMVAPIYWPPGARRRTTAKGD